MKAAPRMQLGAGALALALAQGCLGASSAALANLRSEDLAIHWERSTGDTEGSNAKGDEAWAPKNLPAVVKGTQAVMRVPSLAGPDFTKGDAAWRERLAALVKRRPDIFSEKRSETHEDATALAAAAPLTALYVLARNHGKLFPNGAVPNPLRVHVLGAAYTFEGRGDWQLLAEALPPGVSLDVSLVLGTPREADGVPEMEGISKFKQKICGEHGTTKVHCIESYYQDVMEGLARPHLAMMFNPGFPQVHRRTWDKSMLFLLRERIPTAVSAQVTSDNRWPEAGKPWDSYFFSIANEDFPVSATLEAYKASVWSTTGSPFPIVAARNDGTKFIKNGVIELFQGVRRGAAVPPPPAALPPNEVEFLNKFDWLSAERVTDDDTMHDEMRGALLTPVSDAFVRAADTVYLHFLKAAIDFRGKRVLRGNRIRPGGKLTSEVLGKVTALMGRMKSMEPLGARDWVFLKTAVGMD